MIPFPETVDDYKKLPKLEKCEGDSKTHECYTTVEYPEVTDQYIRDLYKVDLLDIPPHKIAKTDLGKKATVLSMGCRKKNLDIADDKTSRGISQKMCYPENARTMRPDLKKKTYRRGFMKLILIYIDY